MNRDMHVGCVDKKNVPCFSDISLSAAEKLTKYLPTYLEVDRDRPTDRPPSIHAPTPPSILDCWTNIF